VETVFATFQELAASRRVGLCIQNFSVATSYTGAANMENP